MKNLKLWSLLGVIMITGTLAGCGNKGLNLSAGVDAAIDYNDNLVEIASSCTASESDIWNVYDDESASIDDIQKAINNTIEKCSLARNDIKSLGDWEGDSSLKDGVLTIIDKYVEYYTKFNDLIPYITQEKVTEEENESYRSLIEELDTLDGELSEANDSLVLIQKQFASSHGFELEPDYELVDDELIDDELTGDELIDDEIE